MNWKDYITADPRPRRKTDVKATRISVEFIIQRLLRLDPNPCSKTTRD
jgi:hypothetical protein